MMRLVPAGTAMPIHYDDVDVSRSPLADFRRAADAAGLGDRVRYVARGEAYTFEVPA
jgi:hypothetical protein